MARDLMHVPAAYARVTPPKAVGTARDAARDLTERLDRAHAGGGERRIEQQHAKGKLTARERLALLVDPGTLMEFDALRAPAPTAVGAPDTTPGDGVVAGIAQIGERPVAVYAQDFTVQGGSLGRAHAAKICKALDHAVANGFPVVGINDSGGARIQEGVASLAGYGEIFRRNVQASGRIPQITIIAGPCAGGAVYSPALTDLVIMVEGTGHMFLTGPDVVETVTGERVGFEELGGASVHGRVSGVAHLTVPDEAAAFEATRAILDHLPRSTHHGLPLNDGSDTIAVDDDVLDGIVPVDPSEPYPVLDVVRRVVDGGRFIELMPDHAPNARIGLARIGGVPVGVVANDPSHLAGVLDSKASVKIARFVSMCDAFGLPLTTFVDVPGFLPGTQEEWGGVIRHGAKVVHAYAQASVPRITTVLRKAYGGAYIAMCSKHLGADVNLAWPSAEIAVMGAEGAARVLNRRELAAADDPAALLAQLRASYADAFASPYQAAAEGYIDEVLQPHATRPRIAAWLRALSRPPRPTNERPHTNPPL